MLVVSSDAINRRPRVVTVVVGTEARNVEREYPVNVRVPSNESGLSRGTVFLCFQVRSLEPSRFLDSTGCPLAPAGTLPSSRMMDIGQAVRISLDLDPSAT